MKKSIKIISVLTALTVFFTSLTACSASSEKSTDLFSNLEFLKFEADRRVYDDLLSLEENSKYIIIGEIVSDQVSTPRLEYFENIDKELLTFIDSECMVKVKQVLKGDDIAEGDELRLAQWCGIYEDQFITYSEMTPFILGDTWILFLGDAYPNDPDLYECTGDSDGRYPLKDVVNCRTGLTEYEELGVYERSSFKDDIYNDLLEKYDI